MNFLMTIAEFIKESKTDIDELFSDGVVAFTDGASKHTKLGYGEFYEKLRILDFNESQILFEMTKSSNKDDKAYKFYFSSKIDILNEVAMPEEFFVFYERKILEEEVNGLENLNINEITLKDVDIARVQTGKKSILRRL